MQKVPRGFTLVELLIVIAIIVLLVAITAGSVGPIIKIARRAACASQLRGLGQAYLAYATTSGRFPMLLGNQPGTSSYFNSYNFLIVFYGRFNIGFGPLAWTGDIPADYYVCPEVAAGDSPWWHEELLDPENCQYWHHHYSTPRPDKLRLAWPNDRRITRSSYSLRSYLDLMSPAWAQAQGKRALIADNNWIPETAIQRHETGVNVFYIDGSCDYRADEVVWNNELTENNVANDPEMERVWDALDGNK